MTQAHMLPVMYVVFSSSQVTGPLNAAQQMAELLRDELRVVLVVPKGAQIPPERLAAFSNVMEVPMGYLSKKLSNIIRFLPDIILSSWMLRKAMRRDECQRLLLVDFYLLHGALLRLLGYRGQIVMNVRCHPLHMLGRLAPCFLKASRWAADDVVTVSQHIRALLSHPEAVQVIPNAFSGHARAEKTWTPDEAKPIVFVGNYIRGKGQDVALQSFAKVATEFPEASLHFYGSDMGLQKNKEYLEQLSKLAVTLGLEERVFFHPFTKDVQAILENTFLAVNASESESFSMTVLEAQGAGVPVIATKSGGPQEIIVQGETGYLVPVGDTSAIAVHLNDLLSNPEKTERMGRAAAAHVRQNFSLAQFKAQMKALLHL